jgi:hypothetical protein
VSSTQEKCGFLSRHINYELLMLRFTHEKIGMVQDQLVWNAMYESFAVHARNLFSFLESSDDNRNMRASDFNNSFDLKPPDRIDSIRKSLDPHVLHLGKVRGDAERKPHIDRLSELYAWLDQNLIRFGKELPDPFSAYWPSTPDITAFFGPAPSGSKITQSSAPIQSSYPLKYGS